MREKSAYTFDRPAGTGTPLLVNSRFVATADGQLEHWTDGVLRATVPPEGFDSYEETWPQCGDVLREIRGAGRANRPFDDGAGDQGDQGDDDQGDDDDQQGTNVALEGTLSVPARKKKR